MSAFVVSILQRWLGDFLEGITKENLKISLTAGTITQKNVRFRPEALRNLNLPIVVTAGSVELLTVQVWAPWLQSSANVVFVFFFFLFSFRFFFF